MNNAAINVSSVEDYTGSSSNETFVINTISSGGSRAVLDGAGGLDVLDARNVFAGSTTMFFTDSLIEGVNGFSFGDFDAVNFEQIYGNSSRNNWFLLQRLDYQVVVHGGEGNDWFATSFGERGARTADQLYGHGGDDYFNVRYLDQAYGGAGDDVFSLSGSSEDLSGSLADGGTGIDTLELSFGWTADLSNGFADSPFSGSLDRYSITNIENVEVYAWRSYHSSVSGDSGRNVLSVNDDFNDGSVGVFFNGRAGSDLLLGSKGSDELIGGAGKDILHGEDGNDLLYGGSGPDVLSGGAGGDVLNGGAGIDTASYARSMAGVDVSLLRGTGLHGDAQGDTLTDLESLEGTGLADTLEGNEDANVLDGLGGADILNGLGGADTLNGGDGKDTLFGQGGEDTIRGGANVDVISGGSGADRIFGDEGSDSIDGDTGSDWIDGGEGDDAIFGGTGSDQLIGGAGDDVLNGEGFTDIILGGDGADILSGGGSSDDLYGGSQADQLFGNNAKDFLDGGSDDDFLNGGRGNDELHGGQGDDILIGSIGDDQLFGEHGADIFAFRANHGSDRIFDFEDGTDLIEFDINSLNDIGDLTLTNVFAGVDIDYGTGTIRVLGLDDTDFSNADFVFL